MQPNIVKDGIRMTNTSIPLALIHYGETRLSTYVQELRELCAIECPTSSKPGVDQAGAWVQQWATRRGWGVQVWPDPTAGDGLTVTIRGSGRLRVLLAAHLDTVYPIGIAAERPMRTVDGKLIGPGTCDNKSGLLSALYAMAALEDLGLLAQFGTLTLVCGGDEETDMRASMELLTTLAPAYDLALVLEAGRENGDIVGARKGGGLFTLETHGRAAHAGVEPEKGAHAILAIAHQIVALQALNGLRPGVTVNVGVLSGGSVPNAVPDAARAEIDARVVSPADVAVVTAAITAIAERTVVPGVTATLTGSFRMGPMAKTPAIAALAELTAACAVELGFTVKDAATGGISYANLLAELGLPVLDGLGPIGGLDHSPSEYIEIDSIVPRTALLALLMLRRAEQE
jgi:glutamate carboxypeptidase